MKVRYTRRAISELLGIADYIHYRNPSAAIVPSYT
jgi:plasmid stabilization system protein ParE